MKIKLICAILIGASLFSCKSKKENKTPDELLKPIELTGDQNEPLTLTDRITDASVPDYIVSSNYNIKSAVTIEPGVTIKMKNSANIYVKTTGSLRAIGTAGKKIKFVGEQPISGYWGTIAFSGTNNPLNNLTHCEISHGGNNNSYNAMVYGSSTGQLTLNNVSISNGSSHGIYVYSNEFKLHSTENVMIANCQTAVSIKPTQLNGISNTLEGSNNTFNRIHVRQGYISQNTVFSKCELDYFVDGEIEITSDVQIQAGNRFIFSTSGNLYLQSSGSLRAIGTLLEPIYFTGEVSIAGSWEGIFFSGSNSPLNELQHCNIGYGGNDPSWNALVYLYDGSNLTLGNCNIHHSASYGLVNHSNSNTLNDEGTNTFTNNTSGDIGN